MIATPFYPQRTTIISSQNDGLLFHYTSFDNFMKIIQSMTLHSTPLCRMNDLNEANLEGIQWDNIMMPLNAERYVKNECSIICFSKNYVIGPNCLEGTNHPALWAHYADNSNGVCIVLDKKSLIEINKELLSSLFYKFESVTYDLICAPNVSVVENNLSVSEFIQQYCEKLFFKKHKDWSYEGEERFFVEKSKVHLNIKGAIEYVVLGGKFSDENRKRLVTEMISPRSNLYHYFNLHSFAMVIPDTFGYQTVDAAMYIQSGLEQVAEMAKLAEDYKEWMNSNFN